MYTGYTNRLEERIENHREGTGAKYTRGRGPFELVYTETFESKSEAMSREANIKKFSRDKKEEMINQDNLT